MFGRCAEADLPCVFISQTWNTGPLLSDSCGYIAISHEPFAERIVVAFRGTYSIANTIVDLSVATQEYLPYPAEDNDDPNHTGPDRDPPPKETKCTNCTVHAGFLTSWRNTRDIILSHLRDAREKHPEYQLVLVGHSLGGAVAALAGLELKLRGWNPTVTTFGEPRIGNTGLAKFIDAVFNLDGDKGSVSSSRTSSRNLSFRRVTHVGDPIPLLPLEEWGYRMHAGEIFITKQQLSPTLEDVQFCDGDADKHCIAGSDCDEVSRPWLSDTELLSALQSFEVNEALSQNEEEAGINAERNPFSNHQQVLGLHHPRMDDPQPKVEARYPLIPPRYRLLELFRSHRDYFLRIGLCFPSLEGS